MIKSALRKEEIVEIAREVFNQRDIIIQEEFDSRYHDVKLLMKNYRMLKAHYAHVSPETLEVNVICSMRRKTSLMMSHVDKMLTAYKALCYESGRLDEKNRWDALYLRYIDDERITIDGIAEKLNIDRRTYFRYISYAMEDLAVLLFGIEAIGTWRPKKVTKARA